MVEAANIAQISKEKNNPASLSRNSDLRTKDSVGAAKEREPNAMTNVILRSKNNNSPEMKRLLVQASAVEDRFKAKMRAMGGHKLIRRPDTAAFREDVNEQQNLERRILNADPRTAERLRRK